MKAYWAALGLLLAVSLALIGCSSGSSSTNNGTAALYLATQGDSSVYSYQVNTSNGIINSVGSAQAVGGMPIAMAISPSGTNLFEVSQADSSVSTFTLNSDGSLGSATSTPLAGTPQSIATNLAGTFLFVVIQNSITEPGSVQVFSISSSSLSSVGTFSAGIGASGVAVSPSGNQVYVANSVDGTVSAYAVDSTGNLSLIAPAYTTGGTSPTGVGIVPSGNFVYVTNAGSNNVSAFTACIAVTSACPVADGSLIAVTGSPFSTGLKPTVVHAHPTLDVLYVLNAGSNQVSQFTFSTGSGVLTAMSPPSISTGLSPVSMVVHPGGLQVFTANNGGSSLTGYNINQTTGALMPTNQLIQTQGQPTALATQ